MQFTSLDLWFWALTLFGHVMLLGVISVRRYGRDLPIFTTLILMEVVRTSSLFLVFRLGTKLEYRNVYWLFAILDVGLELAVVYELATRIFRPLGTWANDVKKPTILLSGLSVLIAIGLTYLGAPATHSWREWVALKGGFVCATLMSELLIGMFALSTHVGLPSRVHVAAIALGFGAYSMLDLLIETAHSVFGHSYSSPLDQALSRVRIGGYLVCLAFWNYALWRVPLNRGAISEAKRVRLLRLQQQAAADVALFRRWRR